MKWSIIKQRSLYQGFFKLTEFEIQHEGLTRRFRGARRFDGESYEAVGKVGKQVTVRYLPEDPAVSTIEPG